MSSRYLTRFNSLASVILSLLLAASYPLTARELVVGVEKLSYFPHYSYDDEFGHRGVYKEILFEFGKKHGYQFSYLALPIERLYISLLSGKVDLKYPDNPLWKTQEKENYQFYYSEPVVTYVDGLLVHPDNVGMGVDQLKSIGVPLGFTPVGYESLIESGQVSVVKTNTLGSLLQLAMLGRVDGAYINVAVGKYQLKTKLANSSALLFDPSLPYVKDGYRLSSIKYPEVVQEFNEFLKQEEKSINRLKEIYGVSTH